MRIPNARKARAADGKAVCSEQKWGWDGNWGQRNNWQQKYIRQKGYFPSNSVDTTDELWMYSVLELLMFVKLRLLLLLLSLSSFIRTRIFVTVAVLSSSLSNSIRYAGSDPSKSLFSHTQNVFLYVCFDFFSFTLRFDLLLHCTNSIFFFTSQTRSSFEQLNTHTHSKCKNGQQSKSFSPV